MDEREMGSQPPVIILDHFSFTSLSLSHIRILGWSGFIPDSQIDSLLYYY